MTRSIKQTAMCGVSLALIASGVTDIRARQPGTAALKPAIEPTTGTWQYTTTVVQPDGTSQLSHLLTVTDDRSAWTVTDHITAPVGPVTDVYTLEKGTLILREESVDHFPKPGQAWKYVHFDLNFTNDKATGIGLNPAGEVKAVAIDLKGPVFADQTGMLVTIGCLPLTDGYSTTFRTFNINTLSVHPEAPDKTDGRQLRVAGSDATDSRIPVKSTAVLDNAGRSVVTTALVRSGPRNPNALLWRDKTPRADCGAVRSVAPRRYAAAR